MDGRIYGIDLGTTNSAIAICEGEETRIIKNTDGYETTPSVVFFTGATNEAGEDETFVGIEAKNSAAMNPDYTVKFIKRFMGESYAVPAPSGTAYTPEMVSSLILRKLCQGVEQYEGDGVVRNVVITVPAYFDDARRTATKQAGAMAGLNVVRVINEPTAAAIAFGLESEQGGKALVYDLGGGTFDVTIMNIAGGGSGERQFDVIGTGGDAELGGVDFDNEIVRIIRTKLEAEGCVVDDENDALFAEMQDKAERFKLQLSSAEKARIPFTVGGKTHRVEITREEFERASAHLMDRTRYLLEEVLDQAHVSWEDIDHVLAVGGSTRMPMVKRQLENLSGRQVAYKVDPDTAVARGAAIFASTLDASDGDAEGGGSAGGSAGGSNLPVRTGGRGIGPAISISDVTSQSLGVITVDEFDHSRKLNTIIIPRNTKIPTKMSEVVCTAVDNQTSIKVEVTEGDDPDVEYVRRIGESVLAIPPYPKGSPVEIFFAYDPDQTIFIEVIDRVTDRSLGTFEIERTANLSDAEVSAAMSVVRKATVD